MSQELSGSASEHPLGDATVIYVYGWPGTVVKDSRHHTTPGCVVAHTEPEAQNLTFRRGGLGVLRLDATNLHAPGANIVLTVCVPEDIEVQQRHAIKGDNW
jgi:hypothetical protein